MKGVLISNKIGQGPKGRRGFWQQGWGKVLRAWPRARVLSVCAIRAGVPDTSLQDRTERKRSGAEWGGGGDARAEGLKGDHWLAGSR